MAHLLFYQSVVPLNADYHRHWCLTPPTDYRFAAGTNSVPVTLGEMVDVAREMPLVFAPVGGGDFLLAALLGLRQDENLFVAADGAWTARYVPAFIRRYPFILSHNDRGEHVVCFDDTAVATIHRGPPGAALFDPAGAPAPALQACLQLLDAYRLQAEATAAWVRRIVALDLLEPVAADARLKDGGHFVLDGLYVISRARFQGLAPDQIQALFAADALAGIYAHFFSIASFNPLVDRLGTRRSGHCALQQEP